MTHSQAAEMSVPCTYCGANEDEPCKTRSGKRARYMHDPRWNAARAAFFHGYCDGLRDAINQPETAVRQLAFFERRWSE